MMITLCWTDWCTVEHAYKPLFTFFVLALVECRGSQWKAEGGECCRLLIWECSHQCLFNDKFFQIGDASNRVLVLRCLGTVELLCQDGEDTELANRLQMQP